MKCGQDGICSGANDFGTSIDCNQGYCSKAECSKDGQTAIFRFCGAGRVMGREMGNFTKTETCISEV